MRCTSHSTRIKFRSPFLISKYREVGPALFPLSFEFIAVYVPSSSSALGEADMVSRLTHAVNKSWVFVTWPDDFLASGSSLT
jgi:hypothetical protein